MEVYKALSDFNPPSRTNNNVLSFKKGDKFEILEIEKLGKVWWGARSLSTSTVGYVPSKYVKFEERQVGKLLPENYKAEREQSIKRLQAMKDSSEYKSPGPHSRSMTFPAANRRISIPPDYEVEGDGENDNSSSMNNAMLVPNIISYDNWKNLNKVVQKKEHSYPVIPEPDYNEDEDTSLKRDNSKMQRQHNPCLESRERQELHKELLMNRKMGVDVLGKKSELHRALDKRKDSLKQKELDQFRRDNRTSLEVTLENRANQIKAHEEAAAKAIAEEEGTGDTPEFIRVHRRIRTASFD